MRGKQKKDKDGALIWEFQKWGFPLGTNFTYTGDALAPTTPTGTNVIRMGPAGTLVNGYAIYACYFTLNDLNEVSAFTTLYDQYRILEVEAWIIPTCSGEIGNQTQTVMRATQPYFVETVVDYDDAAVTSYSLFTLDNFESAMIHPYDINGGRVVRRRFRPRVASAVYSGAFTSYGNVTPWLDCNSPTVQHYGLKIGFPVGSNPVNAQNPPQFDLKCRYTVQFRNGR